MWVIVSRSWVAHAAVARGLVPRNDAARTDHDAIVPPPPAPASSPSPTREAALVEGESESVHASYQLDMITGELVPVVVEAARVTEAMAGYAAEPGRPAKPRARPRRRRRHPANLVQLTLWPEEQSGG
jgi:hypothetical protein